MKWKNKGHEFDEIGCLLKDKKEVYIYGAGALGEEVFDVIKKYEKWLKWDIKYVDKDINKQKEGVCGVSVISPEKLFSLDKSNIFVIVCASEKSTGDIMKVLIEKGFEFNKNIFTQFYFLYTYLSIHFMYNNDMVFFTSQNIIPSTVCNLNCKHCLNFNPYIKKHIIDEFDSVKQDVDIFFEKVDLIYRFQISGGEPLLYKHLGKLIEYINKNYRKQIAKLEVVTNGTVDLSDEMCKILKDNNVCVILDDYRNTIELGKQKYDSVLDKLRKNNIDYKENYVELWIDILDCKNENKIDKELENLFNSCNSPWSTLKDKKITSCNYSHYAEKASIIEYNENDYFDLTKVNYENRVELIEFRLRYNHRGFTELCKKCAGWTSINTSWVEAAIQV